MLDLNNLIQDNSMSYSAYVLLHRCMADLRDGCKPIHRMIMYSMYKNKTFNLTKSANVCGKVMEFSPHGDCYQTVVNMVQKDKQHVPLIQGKGNFAQHTSRDLQPAASRYSEVKLSDMSMSMLEDLDKNMVNFVDNYDGTQKMPECLPVKYPAILCYNNIGIGVGMSSTICSFNMNEVNLAIIDYIKNGNKKVLVPDLPTYGFIKMDEDEFNNINNTGMGKICMRGRCNVEKNIITITEIPYNTTREAIIDKIIKLVKDGKIKSITSVKDLTDLQGVCIEITCKKSANTQEVIEYLYKNTPLETTYSIEMRMLVDGLPKVLGVWSVIDKWLDFRRECIVNGLTYEVEKLKSRQHILEGFKKIIDVIDDVIDVIKKSEDDSLIKNLMDKFCLTELQAEYIANIKLRNLNKTYISTKIKELDDIKKTIKQNNEIINSKKLIDEVVIKGLEETNKKFKTQRRSQIIC